MTGAGGLVGSAAVALYRDAGATVVAWTRSDLDVTDAGSVRRAVEAERPDAVVHAAAWTDVDGAEMAGAEAMRVNRDGTVAVVAAGASVGATVVAISSDYVFDGTARTPIPTDAPVRPAGAYARSKAAGEAAVRAGTAPWLIVRTGWIYGPGGRNFVDTMRAKARAKERVAVVADQIGAPTSARLVAEAIWRLLAIRAGGIWHVAAAGETSWHGVARAVFDAEGAAPDLVQACTSAQHPRPAPRPAYGVLDCRQTVTALGAPLPPWEEQVRAYLRTGVPASCGLMRVAA